MLHQVLMKRESGNGYESALGPLVHMPIIAMKSLPRGSLCLDQMTSESKFWILLLITKWCPNTISNLSRIRNFQNARKTIWSHSVILKMRISPEREEPMWRLKANDCLGGPISQVALVPDKDSFYYCREVISLITSFAKVLQTWIALGLDPV